MATLAGQTPGTTGGGTYIDLLHTDGKTRATGALVQWGDGEETGLVLWADGVGVNSPTDFVSKFVSAATAARTITIPDAAGTMVLGDGSGVTSISDFRAAIGIQVATLAADDETSSDTTAAVSSFSIPLAASKTYRFSAVLRVKSAATTTGLQPRITGPAASIASIELMGRRSTQTLLVDALDEDFAFTGMAAVDTPEVYILKGVIITNGTTPASELGMSIASEIDTSSATLLAGSSMTLIEI